MHSGVEATLSRLRRRFWLVRGRQFVKNIIRKCVICKHWQGKTLNSPQTPNLPLFRIDDSFSFCNVGLDYAGPLFVRNSANVATSKVYVLLFTCASSRAIHLELVPNMKSEAFIRAFERFISRKGLPRTIINDNFRTFKSRDVKSYLSRLASHRNSFYSLHLGGVGSLNALFDQSKNLLGELRSITNRTVQS